MTVADKTQDNLNMSAVFNMMRQTKARKSKSVCRVQSDVADKKSKIDSLSVRVQPGTADRNRKTVCPSAGNSLLRQTKGKKF